MSAANPLFSRVGSMHVVGRGWAALVAVGMLALSKSSWMVRSLVAVEDTLAQRSVV
jgi:hypothetical protein